MQRKKEISLEVDWTDLASERLKEYINELSDKNLPAAEKLQEEIFRKTDQLPDFPEIYKVCPDNTRYREMVIRRNFRILYRIVEEEGIILIAGFLHSRQSMARFFNPDETEEYQVSD